MPRSAAHCCLSARQAHPFAYTPEPRWSPRKSCWLPRLNAMIRLFRLYLILVKIRIDEKKSLIRLGEPTDHPKNQGRQNENVRRD